MGPTLKWLRKSAGMTQAQVAQAIGLERTSVTNIEARKQAVTDMLVTAWATACGYRMRLHFERQSNLRPSLNDSANTSAEG